MASTGHHVISGTSYGCVDFILDTKLSFAIAGVVICTCHSNSLTTSFFHLKIDLTFLISMHAARFASISAWHHWPKSASFISPGRVVWTIMMPSLIQGVVRGAIINSVVNVEV